ncbi:hypothetical protein ECB94_16480 [Vibrio mediterranei]|uniref:Uncharacterized protein n=1 Tax=Vibrio mediterranei TaxID=689 RepID=A0A3G4VDB4_9VIBR|nr:hypothetical protein ECB94_16480 [Vibrio mediterranei]
MNTRQNITLLPIALLLLLLTIGSSNSPKLKVENDMTDLVILVHGMAKSGRTKGALTRSSGQFLVSNTERGTFELQKCQLCRFLTNGVNVRLYRVVN